MSEGTANAGGAPGYPQKRDAAYQQALEAFPSQCFDGETPCDEIDISAGRIAIKAGIGALTTEEVAAAAQEAASEIAAKCRLGYAGGAGMRGCNYGILCRLGGTSLPFPEEKS